MTGENKRRYERVEANIKLKLPGDTAWTECSTSNVSAGGLFFESKRQLKVGDFLALQFILQAKSGSLANVHFFSSARVVRVVPKTDTFQIAVEFVVDEDVRKEIMKIVEMIKLNRPTKLNEGSQ